ncbi:MAG: ATP-binding protein [Burkholderiaceae bacterium]
MPSPARVDLLEVIDDRAGQRATIITHPLPVEHRHDRVGDATLADAILDRLLARAHRSNLEGPSRRGPRLRPRRPAQRPKCDPAMPRASTLIGARHHLITRPSHTHQFRRLTLAFYRSNFPHRTSEGSEACREPLTVSVRQ